MIHAALSWKVESADDSDTPTRARLLQGLEGRQELHTLSVQNGRFFR